MKRKIGLLCILVIAVILCLVVIRFTGQAKYQDVIDTGIRNIIEDKNLPSNKRGSFLGKLSRFLSG